MIIKTEGRDAFLEDETYHRLTAALAAVQPAPGADEIEPWQFVEVLGDVGGIWPAETLTDPARVAVV